MRQIMARGHSKEKAVQIAMRLHRMKESKIKRAGEAAEASRFN